MSSSLPFCPLKGYHRIKRKGIVEEVAVKSMRQYMLEDRGMDEKTVEEVVNRLFQHPEVYDAFNKWLAVRDYSKIDLRIAGYSPADVAKILPYLTAPGVFSYMAWLAEDPRAAALDMENRRIRF